jgi:hypothetical protein
MPFPTIPADPEGWGVPASGNNALATATKAAATGRRHILTGVVAGFGTGTVVGRPLCTVKVGATTVFQGPVEVTSPLVVSLPNIPGAENEAVSAELAASGTASVLGYVTLLGRTVA